MHSKMPREKYHDICEMKAQLLHFVETQIAGGLTCNPQEVAILGEYVDMIKDLAEAEKSCQEACYYESVVEAMQDSEMYGNRMGYSPQRAHKWSMRNDMTEADRRDDRRNTNWHEMDDEDDEMRDLRHGEAFNRFRAAKRHYTETHSETDRQKMKMHANEHLVETLGTLREMWDDADPDLKKRMKSDLTKLTGEMTV